MGRPRLRHRTITDRIPILAHTITLPITDHRFRSGSDLVVGMAGDARPIGWKAAGHTTQGTFCWPLAGLPSRLDGVSAGLLRRYGKPEDISLSVFILY